MFADVAPDAVPSPALTTGAVADEFDRALWARLADADLLSLLSAEEYGGAGLDAVALCLVLRESAKVLARVPLLESSAAMAAVQAYGGPELRAALLERAGRGEVVLTVAASGRTGHDPAELAVTARQEEGREPTGSWTACRRRCRGRTTRTTSSSPRTRLRTGRSSRWCPGAMTAWRSASSSPPAGSGWASCGWSRRGSPRGT